MDRYQELERALASNGEAKKKQNPAESEVFKMATKKTTNERIREILVAGEYQKNRRNNFWNARRCKKAKRVAALYNTAVVEKLVQDRVIFPSSGADLQEKARHTKTTKSDLDSALSILGVKARQYDPLATHNALKGCLLKELCIDDLHHLLLQSFHLTLPVPQLVALFRHFDADGSGSISYLEFLVKFTRLAISEKNKEKIEHNTKQRQSTKRIIKEEAQRRKRFTQWVHKVMPARFSVGDLQTALAKINAAPLLSGYKVSEMMAYYEMQGLLEPDEFCAQLRTNFRVKLNDHELAAVVAIFDPHASGYLEMTEFIRGFQMLRQMSFEKYVPSLQKGDSAWNGGRLQTPAAAGLLNERLQDGEKIEAAWRPVTREEGNYRRRGLTREGRTTKEHDNATSSKEGNSSGRALQFSSKPAEWDFAVTSESQQSSISKGYEKSKFTPRVTVSNGAITSLSSSRDGVKSKISRKEIMPRLYGKPKARRTIRPNRQGSTSMLLHTNIVLDLHDPLASLSNGKMSTGAVSGHAQEKRTTLLFVAKWATIGQWIAALENEHFRLEDLRHQLTLRAWEATNRRNHEHAHKHHFAGLKDIIVEAPKPQPMRRMALSRQDFTGFCEEAFDAHVWTTKASARLFSSFDAARQNFIWTTELVSVTASIDKVNRNRSNARAGGSRAEVMYEFVDIMMDIFRECSRELIILEYLRGIFVEQQMQEADAKTTTNEADKRNPRAHFDTTADKDGTVEDNKQDSLEEIAEMEEIEIPEPDAHAIHSQLVPADMLICLFSSFSCSDMDTFSWERVLHDAFHAVPPQTADLRHPENAVKCGVLPRVEVWGSPSKNSSSPVKSKKPRNQQWNEAGFLRLLRSSPDLVDHFKSKLDTCADRAGRGGGMASSKLVKKTPKMLSNKQKSAKEDKKQ